jgi:signal peptidase I
MEPGMGDGDLAVVRCAEPYGVGDVVAFRIPEGDPGAGRIVIHRIVGVSPAGFLVQGDNKPRPDWWFPTEDDIVGSLWFTVPGGGRLLGRLRDPSTAGALAAAVTVFTMLLGDDASRSRSRRVAVEALPTCRMRDAWTLRELSERYRAVSRINPQPFHNTAIAITAEPLTFSGDRR